jgi:hypothetical protein
LRRVGLYKVEDFKRSYIQQSSSGQTEGLEDGLKVKPKVLFRVDGWVLSSRAEWVDGWVAKVDNGFG